MKVGEAFPSKYLSAKDLNGDEIALTIQRVDSEAMNDGTAKLVVYFKGAKKGLALNKTNASRIAMRYGDETDEWGGAQVVLYPDVVNFQGQVVDCIRLRVPGKGMKVPPKKMAEPDEPEDIGGDPDEIPF